MPADKEEELLEILNEDQTSTGIYLPRKKVHEELLWHNEVSLLVINEKNEILLERRNKNKKFNPSKLGLVGGHVVESETLEEAIKKEAFEEVGVYFDEVTLFDQRKHIEKNNHAFKNRFYTFTNKKLEDYHVQKEEVDEVIYINFYDFLEIIKNKDNETVYNYKDDSEMFLKLKDIIEKRRG